ncbi:MAG: hypothetical protein CEE40_04795 [Chloroflexi bacterium B3_Chlor]|nr:MAG: hypothetical protein CEE40_04795 [Chloroflexi bacterium B3_Chlor]
MSKNEVLIDERRGEGANAGAIILAVRISLLPLVVQPSPTTAVLGSNTLGDDAYIVLLEGRVCCLASL